MAAGTVDQGAGDGPIGALVGELRRAGVGQVEAGTRRRAEYGADASNYRVVPRVVVFPREEAEVLAALEVCRRGGVPLTARGAGTSIAGNAVGEGVVLDFSRHMNRVLGVDPQARTAQVQPGAVLDAITAAGAPYGLRFGPDPSTHARATIGGSLGNNACGARALAYGRTADNAVELEVVTGSGVRFTARRRGGTARAAGPERELLAGLDTLVGGRLALIRTEFGRFTRQVSGYSLEHLLPENGADLAKFLVGTEGTLALLLRATVRLVEAPRHTAMAVLGYPDMAEAADAVPALLPHRPVALEGMSSQLVDVLRTRRGQGAVPAGLPRGGGWIFAETAGDSAAERSPRPTGWPPTRAAWTRRSSPARRPARCGGSVRTARASAAAPRRATRPGPAGRTPRCRPASWARTCANSPP
ncbi:FAD binding domain-containing protein [Streptomyces sp. DvalAA-14]|nr:FAD binding domain-containing protein [Streptomyces sp. DvalAA-14]